MTQSTVPDDPFIGVAPTADPEALAPLVSNWLPDQRFFAGKSRAVESLRCRLLGRVGQVDFHVQLWLASVDYVDGGRELYQVPLFFTPDAQEMYSHAHLGEVRVGERQLHVYDAMVGRNLPQAFITALAGAPQEPSAPAAGQPADETPTAPGGAPIDEVPAADVAGVSPGLDFHRIAATADLPLGASSRALTGEQSNTSIVFGDRAIMKLFRRLEVGVNPDIEIHDALSRAGSTHIARLLGHLTADLSGDQGNFAALAARADDSPTTASLAMVQDFMSTATDGWELAKASVRDLMAEGDLHAEEAGGDFAAEAFRLGKATAEVHRDLVDAFGTETLSPAAMRERADAMLARLDAALELVPALADVADTLRGCYETFALSEPLPVQRVHGDLHLGQVLRTSNRWVVLDFEGEPAKSITDRQQMDSPLRDVAGMLRSFDYAANHQALDNAPDSQHSYRAGEWAARNRDAFTAGYATAGVDPQAHAAVLRAFEADKAVYEAVYEARNRPAWLAVPLASLGRLSGTDTADASSAATAAPDREDDR